MKAISVTGNTVTAGDVTLPVVRLYADSAIGRDVQPLFIPDIASQWLCHICVAVRIERLGKCIAQKFAHRYVDAMGLVALIEPVSEEAAEIERGGVLSIMDSAVTTGQWCLAPGLPSGTLTVSACGLQRRFEMTDLDVPRLISLVSRAATVKTGDMLILRDTAITLPLTPDTWIKASMSGAVNLTECLCIKVK